MPEALGWGRFIPLDRRWIATPRTARKKLKIACDPKVPALRCPLGCGSAAMKVGRGERLATEPTVDRAPFEQAERLMAASREERK